MRQRGIAKTIGLLVVALAVVCAIGYALMQPEQGWPDEARRVQHAEGGFSLVQPKGFEPHLTYASSGQADEITFVALKSVGNPSKFNAHRIAGVVDPAKLSGYTAVTFQGQPAWQRDRDVQKTRETTRSVIFQRDGRWFEVYAHLPNGQTPDTGAWAAYFESFRSTTPREVPNLAALPPASAPATRP